MSYARFGSNGSDVYVFADADGGITCCACTLNEIKEGGTFPSSTRLGTFDEMIKHLKKHQGAGDCVPQEVFDYLIRDKESGYSLKPMPRRL